MQISAKALGILHLDNLMSRISQATKQRRKRMRQAAHRMRIRIRNLVDECQKQTACYLTSNYRVIFLPTFESSQMVAKARRKIRSKTARAMLTWAHSNFSFDTLRLRAVNNDLNISHLKSHKRPVQTPYGEYSSFKRCRESTLTFTPTVADGDS